MEQVLKDFSELDISNQIITFLWFIGIGGVFCVIYDMFRAIRRRGNLSRVATFFADVLYILFFAFIVYSALLVRCNGRIRIFALMGCVIGWSGVRLTLSRWIYKFFSIIISFMIRIKDWINLKILRPIKTRIPIIFKGIKAKFGKVKNKYIKYLKKEKKHLQKDKELVYNQKKGRHRKRTAKKTDEVYSSERNTFY